MVEKSVKLSSKNTTPVDIISQALASKSLARRRNLKVCGNKGGFSSLYSDGDLAKDLSDISDAEIAGYLSNKKEFLLKKIAWEMMNPDYQKEKQRKATTKKKKDINKSIPMKKTSATRTENTAKCEDKKRPSSEIDYDVLDSLFDDENSPKRAKLDKPVAVGDQIEYSEQSSEESLLKPQGSEEEEQEPDWNEDYGDEDAYGRDEEVYGDADLKFDEDQDEEEEGIIW